MDVGRPPGLMYAQSDVPCSCCLFLLLLTVRVAVAGGGTWCLAVSKPHAPTPTVRTELCLLLFFIFLFLHRWIPFLLTARRGNRVSSSYKTPVVLRLHLHLCTTLPFHLQCIYSTCSTTHLPVVLLTVPL